MSGKNTSDASSRNKKTPPDLKSGRVLSTYKVVGALRFELRTPSL